MKILILLLVISITYGDLNVSSAQTSKPGFCNLKREAGPCRALYYKFAYNQSSGVCEEFIYGGCGGNSNNFFTQEECETTCGSLERTISKSCTGEPVTGLCRAYSEAWYYNSSTETCNSFIYGGCGGNGNKYKSHSECLQQCKNCPVNSHFNPCGTDCPLTCDNHLNPPDICNLMCRIGCECDEGYVLARDGNCILPENCALKDCPVNSAFSTCGTPCPLTCDNYLRQPDFCTRNCKIGCECLDGFVLNEDGRCVLPEECPVKTCPTNSKFNSCGTYCPLTCGNYENPPEFCIQMCKSGCECESGYVLNVDGNCVLPETCTNDSAEICKQPRKVGPCRALKPRFYYNQVTKRCQRFYYGGCQGNNNNFKTLDECESTCLECVEHSRYQSCGSACPLTCNNYRNPPKFCILRCDPGCHCKEGYVLTDDNRCVLPHECEINVPLLPFACQQEKETGTCGQNFSRFFYNRSSAQCEEFVYKGCGGNDNNFQSSEDCEAVCQIEQVESNRI